MHKTFHIAEIENLEETVKADRDSYIGSVWGMDWLYHHEYPHHAQAMLTLWSMCMVVNRQKKSTGVLAFGENTCF